MWSIYASLTCTTSSGQSGLESHANEGLVGFYGISTIVGYLKLNPIQINKYIFNAKSYTN